MGSRGPGVELAMELATLAVDVEDRLGGLIEERNELRQYRELWSDAEAVRARAAELTHRPEIVA